MVLVSSVPTTWNSCTVLWAHGIQAEIPGKLFFKSNLVVVLGKLDPHHVLFLLVTLGSLD
jgi:hypothetical protein